MLKLGMAFLVGLTMSAGVALASDNQIGADESLLFADAPHMWQCTAYAHGSHSHGFTAHDPHRDTAHRKAVRKCERATGRQCRKVDCHKH